MQSSKEGMALSENERIICKSMYERISYLCLIRKRNYSNYYKLNLYWFWFTFGFRILIAYCMASLICTSVNTDVITQQTSRVT